MSSSGRNDLPAGYKVIAVGLSETTDKLEKLLNAELNDGWVLGEVLDQMQGQRHLIFEYHQAASSRGRT